MTLLIAAGIGAAYARCRIVGANIHMTVGYSPCCLCGKDIEERAPDPCRITVETVNGKWQVWYCHALCFRRHLAKPDGYPEWFLAPAHF